MNGGNITNIENLKKKTVEEKNNIKGLEWYEPDDNGHLKFYPKILADKMVDKFNYINVTGKELDTMVYKDGVYINDNSIREFINKRLLNKDTQPDKHRIATLKEIREKCLIKATKLNQNINLINFKNGMYDIENNVMLPHSPEHLSTIQINYDYNKNNKTDINDTLFGHLLRTSLNDDSIELLQEIFGYCLSLNMEIQKFFIFNGKGSNGKSQVLNVLKALFPSNFVSSLELKHMQDDVRVYNLFNKFLNICSDISSEYIEDDSIIKRATGEDYIQCNPKYRDGFDFECRAKMLFSCNELPNVSDKTFGFLRRLVIIPFDKQINSKDKITSIAKKITKDKNTMESIIIWAIEGLQRVRTNNWELGQSNRIKKIKREYELSNNSVKNFINEFCVTEIKDSFIPVTEFKTLYKLWCETEDISKLGNKNIESTLKSIGDKKKNSKFKGWYYENIAWNKDIFDLPRPNSLEINGTIDNYSDVEREGIIFDQKS